MLPDNLNKDFPQQVLEWVGKYGLSTKELLARNVFWNSQKEQLVFTFKDAAGEVIFWQARNFKYGPKYRTYGSADAVLPIYYGGGTNEGSLVLVEDCISAIKIARQCDSMPCLSSDLSLSKLTRLRRFYKDYKVWLDGNMFHKAQRIARRLEMLGCRASAVYTDLDPKEYSDDEICKQIRIL